MISAAGTWHERQRLIFTLDTLRCNHALLGAIDIKDERFQIQLDVYTGLVQEVEIPTSWYEAPTRHSLPPVGRSRDKNVVQIRVTPPLSSDNVFKREETMAAVAFAAMAALLLLLDAERLELHHGRGEGRQGHAQRFPVL